MASPPHPVDHAERRSPAEVVLLSAGPGDLTVRGSVFAEHEGLGDMLSAPISRAGARVELDKPIVGGLFAFSAAEAAMAHGATGWQPDFRVSAGMGLSF